jgi:hypothetical protein
MINCLFPKVFIYCNESLGGANVFLQKLVPPVINFLTTNTIAKPTQGGNLDYLLFAMQAFISS